MHFVDNSIIPTVTGYISDCWVLKSFCISYTASYFWVWRHVRKALKVQIT